MNAEMIWEAEKTVKIILELVMSCLTLFTLLVASHPNFQEFCTLTFGWSEINFMEIQMI